MANKPLKSIKFPGLADTYTVPEIDNTLTTSGKAADSKKVGDELNDLKSAINSIEGSIYKQYSITDLTDTGTYIHDDGIKRPTPLSLTTSPMIPVSNIQKIVLHKKSPTMTGYSIAYYRKDTFSTDSLIGGYVADFDEGTVSVVPPNGTKYIAFCSRSVTGSVFDASLVYTIAETMEDLDEETEKNTSDIQDATNKIEVISELILEEVPVINKPDSTTSTTSEASIFAIGTLLTRGYYSAKFYTTQEATLYMFAVDSLEDTSLTLKTKITKRPDDGVVSFNSIKVSEQCILGLSGAIGYKASPNSPYYSVTYSSDTYTKPATASGNVVFNIELKRTAQKANDVAKNGIPYIAHSEETVHIKLIGDSITQGSGSTGYVEWTADGLVYRGNAPDYPDAGSDYQVGQYLGSYGVIRWYEALDGSGWGQLIKAYFEEKFNCSVKNYGMGGATTSNILSQWDNIIDAEDDIVIVMLGTNDRRSHEVTTFYSNLNTIVSKLLSLGKKVIVMSPPPILPSIDADSQYFHMEDACNNSSAVAYNNGCQFIDNFGRFNDYCTLRGVSLNTLLNNDGIHPNDSGYIVLFNNIVKELGLGRKVDGATW